MNNELANLKNIPSEAMNQNMFIGNPENPIDIIKRSEIKDYLQYEFFAQYEVWKKYHIGFGLPLETSWANHPKFLIDIIEVLEAEFKEFSFYKSSKK